MENIELMSLEEINNFGIEVVFKYLQEDRYETVSGITELCYNPQIIATLKCNQKHL